jgi:hypothetical protein
MFEQRSFYHHHIRKAITAFGTLFNNIHVIRKDAAGIVVQDLIVPLNFATKNKALSRIVDAPDFSEGRAKYEITLPRMSFEITSLDYDGSRKLPVTETIRNKTASEGSKYSYVSTPYNLGVSLSIFAKYQDDGLQIIEQILPFFNPDFNITISDLPNIQEKRDIQFVLNSVSYSDDYAGDFSERTVVMWDLNFTIKMNFYGYVANAELIRKALVQLYATQDVDVDSVIGRRIMVTPDPEDVVPPDPYQFLIDFDDIIVPPTTTTTTTTTLAP